MEDVPKKTPRCPVCRSTVGKRPENRDFPFCSARCRMIDLGKWLGEEYSVSEPVWFPIEPGKDHTS